MRQLPACPSSLSAQGYFLILLQPVRRHSTTLGAAVGPLAWMETSPLMFAGSDKIAIFSIIKGHFLVRI